MKGSLPTLRLPLSVRLAVGVALSALFLYLALRRVPYADIAAALTNVQIGYIGLALLSVAVNTTGKGARWVVLMGPAGRKVPFSKTLAALLVGQMLNNLIPARIGDLSRAYIVGRLGPGGLFVLGTIVLEKLIDMLAFALLFAFLLLAMPLPTWIGRSASVTAAVACLLLLLCVLLARHLDRVSRRLERVVGYLPERVQAPLAYIVRAGLSSLASLRHRPDGLKLILWSAVVWGTAVLNNYLILLAFGLRLPVTASILLIVLLQAGITLPSAPGTIGIFEYLSVLALGLFKIDAATAFSYGVLLHSVVMIPSTLLGLLFFWYMGLSRARINSFSAAT